MINGIKKKKKIQMTMKYEWKFRGKENILFKKTECWLFSQGIEAFWQKKISEYKEPLII